MQKTAHVAHHVRGRIRVKLPIAKGDRHALDRLKHSITPMPGVRSVDTNPSTGSVTVNYDALHYANFHEQLRQYGQDNELFQLMPPELSEVDEVARKLEQEAEFLSAHSETARQIVSVFRGIDRGIKVATNNTVDLKVLLPLGLAVYSFMEIGLDASTPLWVTLGIFSFNSFVTLHGPHPPATVSASEVVSPVPLPPFVEPPGRRGRKKPLKS